jgi:hypothetical protein
MHDWTLKNIDIDWQDGVAKLTMISSPEGLRCITARGFVEIVVPRRQEWGPSESVMHSNGPTLLEGGRQRLEILMQSGDLVLIVAREIAMPLSE